MELLCQIFLKTHQIIHCHCSNGLSTESRPYSRINEIFLITPKLPLVFYTSSLSCTEHEIKTIMNTIIRQFQLLIHSNDTYFLRLCPHHLIRTTRQYSMCSFQEISNGTHFIGAQHNEVQSQSHTPHLGHE